MLNKRSLGIWPFARALATFINNKRITRIKAQQLTSAPRADAPEILLLDRFIVAERCLVNVKHNGCVQRRSDRVEKHARLLVRCVHVSVVGAVFVVSDNISAGVVEVAWGRGIGGRECEKGRLAGIDGEFVGNDGGNEEQYNEDTGGSHL